MPTVQGMRAAGASRNRAGRSRAAVMYMKERIAGSLLILLGLFLLYWLPRDSPPYERLLLSLFVLLFVVLYLVRSRRPKGK